MIALTQEIRLFLLSGYTFLIFVPPSFLKLNPRSFLSSRLTVDKSNPRKLENWFSRWSLASDNENPLIPRLCTNSARFATCLSFTFSLFIHKDRLILLVTLFSVVNSYIMFSTHSGEIPSSAACFSVEIFLKQQLTITSDLEVIGNCSFRAKNIGVLFFKMHSSSSDKSCCFRRGSAGSKPSSSSVCSIKST